MKTVIKIGTQSILTADGTIDEDVLLKLVTQIASLQHAGHQILLVSSGAIGAGRSVAQKTLRHKCADATGERQLLASLGQHELMHCYAKILKRHGIQAAQLLLTKQDFHTRQHYVNIARLLREILRHRSIIPIVNENDSVSIEELMFTDNDELAGLVAAQINADKLIILTAVPGVYDRHPNDPSAELIALIDPETDAWPTPAVTKSFHGRGGMINKLAIARKMSALGITVHIADAQRHNVIIDLAHDKRIGTTILAHKKKSAIKKWIAFNDAQPHAMIDIKEDLSQILTAAKRAVSILPIGVKRLSGDFKKGDLIDIIGTQKGKKKKVGVGIARYGRDQLSEYLGMKGKPAFIHYDYLHIYQDDKGAES